MPSIRILVGTMTGTAEMIAEEIIDAVGDAHALSLKLFEDMEVDELSRLPIVLVISSTYGEGEVPETSLPFFETVEKARPDLSRTAYGVIALGDRSAYGPTFAFGAQRWDRLLAACGARRIGDVLLVDSSDPAGPNPVAVAWAKAWIEGVAEERPEAGA